MLIENFCWLILFIGALFAFAEYSHRALLGIIASLFILLLGIAVSSEGLFIHSAEVTTVSENQTILGLDNSTDVVVNETTTGNVSIGHTVSTARLETTTPTYSLMTMPFLPFSEFFGLILIVLGIYGVVTYAGNFVTNPS